MGPSGVQFRSLMNTIKAELDNTKSCYQLTITITI